MIIFLAGGDYGERPPVAARLLWTKDSAAPAAIS